MKSLSAIAKELGVSVAAVSYVYHGKWRENRIGAELARRIQEKLTAEPAGPSALGNQLRTGKTQVIGIVLSDLTKHYYLDLLCGIEQELAAHGYLALLCHSDQGNKGSHYLGMLLARGVDGIILAPHRPGAITAQLQEIKAQNLPIVLVDNYLPETYIDFVVSDNRWGASQAIQFCVDQGCRQIGCAIDAKSSLAAVRDRFLGTQDFQAKAGAAGGIPRVTLLPSSPSALERSIAAMVARGGRCAIFAGSLCYFEHGFKVLSRMKLRIPGDIILTGFDPVPMEMLGELCAFLDAPLPVVKQPGLEMGTQAARRLIARIKGKAQGACQTFLRPHLSFAEQPKGA